MLAPTLRWFTPVVGAVNSYSGSRSPRTLSSNNRTRSRQQPIVNSFDSTRRAGRLAEDKRPTQFTRARGAYAATLGGADG